MENDPFRSMLYLQNSICEKPWQILGFFGQVLYGFFLWLYGDKLDEKSPNVGSTRKLSDLGAVPRNPREMGNSSGRFQFFWGFRRSRSKYFCGIFHLQVIFAESFLANLTTLLGLCESMLPLHCYWFIYVVSNVLVRTYSSNISL